jgi:ribosomal protein L29
LSIVRRPRKDPVTNEIREMTDEEYLALLLENLDKVFELDVSIDQTGKGTGKFRRKQS